MEKLSIRIKICDRIYPMKVSIEDESLLREAAKKINDKVAEYSSKFGNNDYQDLLSIVCFEAFVELKKERKKLQEENKELSNAISEINSKIENINS